MGVKVDIQANGIETPEINHHMYSQTIFSRETRPVYQYMVLGKPDIHLQKDEAGLFPYIIYKNLLKMDPSPKSKS